MISLLGLRNFKCWASEEVPLGALTLLTGLNGTGKSTVLQSLLVLRQSYVQGLLQQGKLAINGDLIMLGTGQDAFCEDAEDDELGLRLTWSDGHEAAWSFHYDKTADVLEGRPGRVPSIPERPPFAGEVYYLAAERLGPRVSAEVSEFRVRVLREVGSRGELAAHFLSVHGSTPIGVPALEHPESQGNDLMHQVEAWLGEVSPGARMHLGEHRDLDAVQLRFSFAGPMGATNAYRATNVGFGMSYTLPILIAVLSARPGALVIIENPEAHLHPRGQVRIAELLARAAAHGVQVIVETHSDHILNGVRLAVHDGTLPPDSARIHFFDRRTSSEGTYSVRSSPALDADGRLEPWPAGFFDEIELSLAKLLEPRQGP